MDGYKILIVFSLMVFLVWRRVSLSYVMLGCSAVLALVYHTGFLDFVTMLWQGIINPVTIELVIILTLIMILECILRIEGYLHRMLSALQAIIPKPAVIMALLPAFIGLMPSAGGAVFSAPLVEHAAKDISITPEHKSFVNFYYRHVTEYFLPIYPSILLINKLTGISMQKLIIGLAPYGFLAILLGIPVLKKISAESKERSFCHVGERVVEEHVSDQYQVEDSVKAPIGELTKDLIFSALPMLTVVFMVLALQVEVWLAVGLVIMSLLLYHRYTPSKILGILQGIKLKTIILVFTVMIFKQVLEDTRAVAGLPDLLAQLPVPSYLVFIAINFLVALMTGHMVATLGIGFPIAMAAMGPNFDVHMAILLFMAGFTGQMMTPVHLCLTLTVDFFKADINKVVKMLIGPEVTLLATALGVYLIFFN